MLFSRRSIQGDRWFASIIGCLSITKGLFYRVVPADQSFAEDDYCGLFRFRIWWHGEWQEVLVDDRLPTVNNKLVFVHSMHGNQFWTSLLEKVSCLAKLDFICCYWPSFATSKSNKKRKVYGNAKATFCHGKA